MYSFKYRIAVIIFTLELIMMTIVLWQTLGHSQQSTRDLLQENEQALLGVMSGISRSALLTEKYADLQTYFENLLKDSRIVQVLLVDASGLVVSSTRSTDIGKPPPDFEHHEPHQGQSGFEYFWRSRQIKNDNGLLGQLAVKLSNKRLMKLSSEAWNLGVGIAIAGMFLIAVIGLLVGIALTRRLEQVSQTAKQLAEGRLEVRTGIYGRDEIGALGQSFDQMAARLEQHQRSLQEQVAERTVALEAANRELESFSYSVSHDLRAPLRSIDGFSLALIEDFADSLDDTAKDYLTRVRKAAQRMGELIDNLLSLSQVSRFELHMETIDLNEIALSIISNLSATDPQREVDFQVSGHLTTRGDPRLIKMMLENLLGNAWKFTARKENAVISLQSLAEKPGVFYIRDNGVGFDMRHVNKLFGVFQRLHHAADFPGTGIGLATVQRIINRHGGRIWAESKPEKETTFYFTLQPGEL